MRSPRSRRRILQAALSFSAAAVAGCAIRAPSRRPEPATPLSFETDTSGDGIPDLVGQEIDAVDDPLRKNVIVEVDRVEGVPYRDTLAFARSVFADAPVENPDGSTGIDVHFLVDEPILRSDTNAAVQRDYHFGYYDASVFDRRHRGVRHLVVLDDLYGDGWYADPFVMAVAADRATRLVDGLAAHLAGRFDPLVADGPERSGEADGTDNASETGQRTDDGSTADPRLWLPDAVDPTADQLLDAIDWSLVARHLPKTTPPTRWYERKYAHLAAASEDGPPHATAADLGPAVGQADKDTSGDGIPDRLLLSADVFAGASPFRKNVFVEVDYQRGIARQTVEKRLREIQTVFGDAPVRNPDGSMGIDVHFTVDSAVAIDGPVDADDVERFRTEFFERRNQGYFYVLFVRDLKQVTGLAARSSAVMFAEPWASTALHELGHALGISGDLSGVDEQTLSFREYPSVMNYNAPPHALVFASDPVAPDVPNDWQIIEQSLPAQQPSISRL